jgi:hypothetical protein
MLVQTPPVLKPQLKSCQPLPFFPFCLLLNYLHFPPIPPTYGPGHPFPNPMPAQSSQVENAGDRHEGMEWR